MDNVEDRLKAILEGVTPVFLRVTDADASRRPASGAWSAKEIIGHLIDSAANNHRRFVEAHFTDELIFPGYAQDAWVSTQRYQERPWGDLVELWRTYNLHLAHVIASIPSSIREKARVRHNLHVIAWHRVPEKEATTLQYFMADYLGHLEHHVSQLLTALDPAKHPAQEAQGKEL